MKWTYSPYDVEESLICPSGLVYRPEVKLRVVGSSNDAYLRALVDTGADQTLLPISIAGPIGAELFENENSAAHGLGGDAVEVVAGRVELELSNDDDDTICRWFAIVAFADFKAPAVECSILGHGGCLEYFLSSFNGVAREFELTSQTNFPGIIT